MLTVCEGVEDAAGHSTPGVRDANLLYLWSRGDEADDDEGIFADTVLTCITKFITQKLQVRTGTGQPGDLLSQFRSLPGRSRTSVHIEKLFTPKREIK